MRRTRHTHFFTVPRGIFLDIVKRTDTTQYHALVVVLIAVVHIELPIPIQSAVEDVVIHLLVHRHWDAVDTDFQRNSTLGSRPDVTTIGTHSSARHSQQGRIFSFLYGHTQYTIGTIVLLHVLERHLIHVHVLRTTLG